MANSSLSPLRNREHLNCHASIVANHQVDFVSIDTCMARTVVQVPANLPRRWQLFLDRPLRSLIMLMGWHFVSDQTQHELDESDSNRSN